jgi:hypothetical protein
MSAVNHSGYGREFLLRASAMNAILRGIIEQVGAGIGGVFNGVMGYFK